MISQKVKREKIEYLYQTEKDVPVLGRENRIKEEKEDQKKLLCPKAGTATSSPVDRTVPPVDMNIVKVMLRVKYSGKVYFDA